METTTIETTTAPAVVRDGSWATQTPGEQAFTLFVFGLGAMASGAFVYYLITNPARLTEAWQWTRSQPLLVQGVIWLLFLPWMVCLWMWALPWAMPVRLVLVVGRYCSRRGCCGRGSSGVGFEGGSEGTGRALLDTRRSR